jgi:hypothetical protein
MLIDTALNVQVPFLDVVKKALALTTGSSELEFRAYHPQPESPAPTVGQKIGFFLLHQPPRSVRPHYRHREEHGVDAIEHASVAGQDRTGVFDAGAALDQRLDEVA